MGLRIFGKSYSSFDKKNNVYQSDKKPDPNPDPNKYIINNYIENDGYLIIIITYPNCTNYEGKKILVFKTTFAELKKQKIIDPHFSDSKMYVSPIARFVPTNEGLEMAKCFVERMLLIKRKV